ncbi:hypothetical protein [Allostreptomyces psammosilenae]|uniref:Uncharacterized protein n=1 Tax=Allostreptomyces psammosilenae TaxID=1892865 RepID=A0A852ZWN0_9ACTN|nr:hypothetical protein [Allostreptomyces psammosilenae]NYI05660.1 hypothetical protein [Allostreptomyces psammosilenae]
MMVTSGHRPVSTRSADDGLLTGLRAFATIRHGRAMLAITHPGNGATRGQVIQRMRALGAGLGICPGTRMIPTRRCYFGPSASTLATADGTVWGMEPALPPEWRRVAREQGGASLGVVTTMISGRWPGHEDLDGALWLDARLGRLMVGWCPVVSPAGTGPWRG